MRAAVTNLSQVALHRCFDVERAALAHWAGAGGGEFDALLRCYLKLLLLLHQVSCCLILHAFIATPAQAPFTFWRFSRTAGFLISLLPAAELLRLLDVWRR